MDFRKFRVGGELSDIIVIIEENQFQLHRFPLYTKSGLFLKEFAKLGSRHAINLENFPGGIEVFTIIADFCYNITIEITVENVVGIRCGAKYLEMWGSGNLYEKTGIFIEEVLKNGKRGKELDKMLVLLSSTSKYNTNEASKHTQEQCLSSLIQHWNKSQYGTSTIEQVMSDSIQAVFFAMDFDFFIGIMQKCQEQAKNPEVVNILISSYIKFLIENTQNTGDNTAVGNEYSNLERSDSSEGSDDSQDSDDSQNRKVSKDVETENGLELTTCNGHNPLDEQNLEKIQTLLSILKPNSMLVKHTTVEWLKPLLQAYSKSDNSSKILGSIAAIMANQMDAECISLLGEQILISFVEKVEADSLSLEVKELFLEHLMKMAADGALTLETFLKTMENLKLQTISCHDNLLHITSVLNSRECIPQDKDLMTRCLSMIDMKLCSAKSLRHAQKVGKIPAEIIANAALDLCEYLQERVDASTKILQEQEKEISNLSLQTFGMRKSETLPLSLQRKYKSRTLSHAALYSPTSSPIAEFSNLKNGKKESLASAARTQNLDGVWAEHPNPLPLTQDANTKLSELLNKQRQSKLWN